MNRSVKPERAVAADTETTLIAIGARIRETRLLRGLTLQELAAVTDLSPAMLSLVERGRASPSIGSLVVIANALKLTMSELIATDQPDDDRVVIRSADRPSFETPQHVLRRVLREDRARGVSIALNEYESCTGSASKPVSHDGFEYGYILEGTLSVELDGVTHELSPGDLIAYDSRRPHRFWNKGRKRVRTLWFNIRRE